MSASGGVAPYSFALASGSSLPTGLTLNKKGTISGVPVQATPSATFDVDVTDSTTPTTCTGVIHAHMVVAPNNQIPTSDGLVQFVDNLLTYGPECVLSLLDLLGGGPPDTNCLGLIYVP
jgi:hypothetical protein